MRMAALRTLGVMLGLAYAMATLSPCPPSDGFAGAPTGARAHAAAAHDAGAHAGHAHAAHSASEHGLRMTAVCKCGCGKPARAAPAQERRAHNVPETPLPEERVAARPAPAPPLRAALPEPPAFAIEHVPLTA